MFNNCGTELSNRAFHRQSIAKEHTFVEHRVGSSRASQESVWVRVVSSDRRWPRRALSRFGEYSQVFAR